jgi:hypothetical protein
MSTARRTNEKLWQSIVSKIKRNNRAQGKYIWSARDAQKAVREYKAKGGRYIGAKRRDNSLAKWTKQKWGYISKGSSRYLPRKAISALTSGEKSSLSRSKKLGIRKRYPSTLRKKIVKYINR